MELKGDRHPDERRSSESARRTWFRRDSISVGEIIVQTFSVVLGILLALGIDNWRRDRDSRAAAAEALVALRTEIGADQRILARHVDHLQAVHDALAKDAAERASTAPLLACNDYPAWTGTGVAIFIDAAYQSAIATQAFAHMTFAQAQRLSAAYASQKTYQQFLDKLLDYVLRGAPSIEAGCAELVQEQIEIGKVVETNYANVLAALPKPL